MRGKQEKNALISFDRIRTGYEKPSRAERAVAEAGLWLVQVVCAALAAAGAARWIVTALELSLPAAALWAASFPAAVFFLTAGRAHGILRRALGLLLAAAAAGYVFFMWEELALGAQQLWNCIADRAQAYYGREIGGFLVDGEEDQIPLLLGTAEVFLVWGLAHGILHGGKNTLRGMLAVLAVFSLCLDRFPDIAAVVMLLCAYVGIRIAGGAVLRGKFSAMLGISGAAVMISTCAALLMIYLGIIPGISKIFVDNHEAAMDLQGRMEMRADGMIRELASGDLSLFGPLPWGKQVESGVLSNNAPDRTGEVKIRLRARQKPEERLLLRGFVGETYEGNRWQEISGGGFEDAVLEQWEFSEDTDRDGLVTRVQRELLSVPQSASEGRVRLPFEMNMEEADEEYGYLPYFAELDEPLEHGIELQGDGETVRTQDSIVFWGWTLAEDGEDPDAEMAAYAAGAETDAGGAQDLKFRQELMQNYQSYVNVKYLSVPDKGMQRLRALCSKYRAQMEGGEMSLDQAAVLVRSLLARQCKYNLRLSPLPAGEDYVDYFLFEQKMGFCTHFASAGTLMFRMLGIPARYVTGYSVSPSSFTETEDGYAEAAVTDYDAHAWVEIFDPAEGWIPVEVTPGYSSAGLSADGGEGTDSVWPQEQDDPSMEAQSTDGEQPEPVEQPELVEEPESGEAVPEEENREEGGEKDEPEEENKKEDGELSDTQENGGRQEGDVKDSKSGLERIWKTILKAAAGAAAVTGVLAAVYLNGRRKRRRRERLFRQKDAGRAVLAVAAELSELIERSGILKGEEPGDNDYGEAVCKRLPAIDGEAFAAFMESARRAKFSREEIEEKEAEAGRALFDRINRELYRQRPALGRLWWKFVKGY